MSPQTTRIGEIVNRKDPARHPVKVTIVKRISIFRLKVLSSLRNPTAPPSYPGKTATALVAFAATGGTPEKTKAAKVKNVPPLSIVFKIPAPNAAKIIIAISNLESFK